MDTTIKTVRELGLRAIPHDIQGVERDMTSSSHHNVSAKVKNIKNNKTFWGKAVNYSRFFAFREGAVKPNPSEKRGMSV
jgi:hypothetical protein